MKKRSLLCLFMILVMLLAAGCNAATNTGFLLYKSSPLGFRMEYPDSWSKQVDLEKHSAAFFTPQEGFGDGYRENVAISYEELGEQEFEALFKQYYEALPSVFPAFAEVEKSEVLVDEKPAYKLVFTSESTEKDQKASLKILQYVVHNGDRVYFITYSAQPANYDYFEPMVNIMLNTFTFNV